MSRVLFATTAVAALLIGAPAAGQQQMQQQPAEQQAIAQQCLDDLRAQVQHMQQEGYWLTGWGHRWTGMPAVPPEGPPGAPVGAPDAPLTAAPDAPIADTATGPWGAAGPAAPIGVMSPSYQIRTLHAAANVLAHRGQEQACQAVLAELQTAYDDYTTRLQEAGVQPGEITSWRQEQMAAAMPVEELTTHAVITADQFIGTDVRNVQDEHLGTVDDLVLDPETGDVSYAIVAFGGFLGIGDDHVAVPWQAFHATPGMNLLVLDMTEAELEQAPRVDPDRMAERGMFQEWQRELDDFWQTLRG